MWGGGQQNRAAGPQELVLMCVSPPKAYVTRGSQHCPDALWDTTDAFVGKSYAYSY